MAEPAPSFTGLVRQLLGDVRAIVASAAALAQAEMATGARSMGLGLLLVLGGVSLLSVAFFVLVAALVVWLGPQMGWVGAALMTAAILSIAGAAALMIGLGRVSRADLAPRRAIAHVQESATLLGFPPATEVSPVKETADGQ
jgi:hypothetical protein